MGTDPESSIGYMGPDQNYRSSPLLGKKANVTNNVCHQTIGYLALNCNISAIWSVGTVYTKVMEIQTRVILGYWYCGRDDFRMTRFTVKI